MEGNYKRCPYCGEDIKANAKKCRHCGEWLTEEGKKIEAARKAENKQPAPKDEETSTGAVAAALGCVFVFWAMVIGGVLLLLHCTIPSEQRMDRAIVADMQECVKDKTLSYTRYLGDGVDALASFFFDSGISEEGIAEQFYNNNAITIDEKWFWSVGRIHNRNFSSEGTVVCFGILGIVFPFVEWNDFVLMDEDTETN